MNEIALHLAAQSEIKKIPTEDREIYEFVVAYEEQLADRASTEEEFQVLLLSREPYEAAAVEFARSGPEIVAIVNHWERHIQSKVSERMKHMGWYRLHQAPTQAPSMSFILTL